jgi:UDP-glucose 4-epimerase
VIFASSFSIYGASSVLPKASANQPLPISPYGVFGPGQDPLSQYASVVPRFIAALASGNQPIVYGDGTQTRDFTYIEDVVEAFVLATGAPSARGEVISMCAGRETSLLTLLGNLSDTLGTEANPLFESARAGEVRASHGNRGKAAALLDWEPQWSLRDALDASIPGFVDSVTG